MNNKKVDVPSYRVSQYDIIDVKEKSLGTLPFQIARETARRPSGPRLAAGSSPAGCAILVHQEPERAQIDVPLSGAAHRRVLLEVSLPARAPFRSPADSENAHGAAGALQRGVK